MGPTAAGKSAWALEQAKKYQGAIVNCDSIQVYKELDIGSSKPSLQERKEIPHYLFDYVDYPQEMTAGQYTRDFFDILKQIPQKVIFVVGGTGFYFQALEQGMYPVRQISDQVREKVQKDLNEKSHENIYLWIKEKDPLYAQKISINDKYRIERAYELMSSENKTVTQVQEEFNQQKQRFPYPYLKIGVTGKKEELLPLVQTRTKRMLQQGLEQEVQMLLKKGYKGWAPLESVGYKEVQEYLEKKLDSAWLEDEINKNTMKLIKKQRTWFQRDKQIINITSQEIQLSQLDSFLENSR